MFTIDTSIEEATRYFEDLFGDKPEICEVYKGHLWVGPIREHPP